MRQAEHEGERDTMTTETTEVTNETRRERGAQVVCDYIDTYGGDDTDGSALRDVLADLMHTYGLASFREAAETAERHFREETSKGRFGFVEGSNAMACPSCGFDNDVYLRRVAVESLDRSENDEDDDAEYLAFDLGFGMDDNAEATFIVCMGCSYEDSADYYSFDYV